MGKLTNPSDVLYFWFSEQVKPLWFKKSEELDRQIKEQFIDTYQLAQTGALNRWRDRAADTLALIIVLDQFPRNMFRNTAQAFATDSQAVELTKYAVNNNYQADLTKEQQTFLYMPLMHSEDEEDQSKCVELFKRLGREDNLKFAIKHQEVIDRFGRFLMQSLQVDKGVIDADKSFLPCNPPNALHRFPHRHKILGRKSTKAEQKFLTQPGSSF